MDDLSDSYRYLSKVVENDHIECSLSEIHGMILGYLIADKYVCYKTWSQLVNDDIPFDFLPEKAVDEIKQLFLYSHIQLAAETLTSIDVLLPPTADCFLARMKGLSDFSRGFLYGFGISDHSQELLQYPDVCEVLNEMTQFSQIDVHNEEDNSQNSDALEHIISYIQEHLIRWKKICDKHVKQAEPEELIS